MQKLSGVEILSPDLPNVEPQRTKIVTPEPERIQWQFWKMNQMRSYHASPAIVELGDISDE